MRKGRKVKNNNILYIYLSRFEQIYNQRHRIELVLKFLYFFFLIFFSFSLSFFPPLFKFTRHCYTLGDIWFPHKLMSLLRLGSCRVKENNYDKWDLVKSTYLWNGSENKQSCLDPFITVDSLSHL